jgi:RHS repeat-associated protein
VTTTFHWDGDTLLNETSADQVSASLIGVVRHARSVQAHGDATTHYLGTDRHGNVADLTTAEGSVQARYRYTDYGVPIPTPAASLEASASSGATPGAVVGDLTHNPYGHAGSYTDQNGTQHLRVRWYDPGTMRFTAIDPAPTHNGYGFADLNPIMRVDPTGNWGEMDTVNTVLLVLGFVFLAVTVGPAVLPLAGPLVTLSFGTVVGGLADLGTSAIALSMLLADNGVDIPIDEDQRKQLEGAEYGLAAVGGLIAAHSLWKAGRKLWGKPTGAAKGQEQPFRIENDGKPKSAPLEPELTTAEQNLQKWIDAPSKPDLTGDLRMRSGQLTRNWEDCMKARGDLIKGSTADRSLRKQVVDLYDSASWQIVDDPKLAANYSQYLGYSDGYVEEIRRVLTDAKEAGLIT